jgi:ribose-phosphate pyrophosphokinase|tara:strand:+ start:66 stop:1037 length:972 start_codon:yes stop_codon:yes gene_type:complete
MEEVAIIADSSGRGYELAKGIFEYVKAKEGRGFSVQMIDIKSTEFMDGEFKVKIADNIRRKKCFLIFDSNKEPCRWFAELAFLLEAMTFSSPEEINVLLPYTRFGRQERKEASRVSVNAKVLADMISMYADRGLTVDLHAAQMQEYFNIPFDNLYGYPSLITHLKKNHFEILDNLVIVSPDLGGGKRAEALVKRLNKQGIQVEIAFGHKTRARENEVSKVVLIGDVEGKNCLIVDDIIDTGGTLIKTAEVLREKGARNVYAYATHGLFTNEMKDFSVFNKVMVSDTLCCKTLPNLEIVSLVDLFGEAIYRTIVGESLSVLFDG